MKEHKLFDAFSLVDDKYIVESTDSAVSAYFKNLRINTLSLAAVFALVFFISSASGIYFTIDTIRYNEAVTYLTQQGYTVEGLTKTEVMEIYNSIISHDVSSHTPTSSNLESSFIPPTSSENASSDVSSTPHHSSSENPYVSSESSNVSSETEGNSSVVPPGCKHTSVIKVGRKEPTCVHEGEYGATVCRDCGYVLIPSYTLSPTGKHSFDNNVCIHCGLDLNIEDYIVFELDESGTSYTVTDFIPYTTTPSTTPYIDLIIPETHNGLPVTAIGDYAFKTINMSIKTLSIPDTVTHIGNRAFSSGGFTYVKLPRDLTYIGKYAFSSSCLTSVDFNEKLEYIDEYAFSLSDVVSISLPDSVTYLGSYCFAQCFSLEELKLSAGLKEINPYTVSFAEITKLVIPEGVVSLREHAFSDCVFLKDITLPSSLREVEDSVFTYYSSGNSDMKINITDLDAFNSISFESEKANPLFYGATLYLNGIPVE